VIYSLADILTDGPKPEKAQQGQFISSNGYTYHHPDERELDAERKLFNGKTILEMSPEERERKGIKSHEGAFILPADVFDSLYGYVEPKRSGSENEAERNNEETAIPEIKIEAERKPEFQDLQDIINTGTQRTSKDNLSEMPYSSDNLSGMPVDNTYVDPNVKIDKELKKLNENLHSTYIDEVINKQKEHIPLFGQLDSEGKPIDNLANQVESTYKGTYDRLVQDARKQYDELPWYIQLMPETDKLKYLGVNTTLPGFKSAGNTLFSLVNAGANLGKDIFGGDRTLYPNMKTETGLGGDLFDLVAGTGVDLGILGGATKTAGELFKGVTNPITQQILTQATGFILPHLPENVDRLVSGEMTPGQFASILLSEGGMGTVFAGLDAPGISGLLKTDGAKIIAKTILPTMVPVASEMIVNQKLPEVKDILSNAAFNLAFAIHGATKPEREAIIQKVKDLPTNEQTLEKITAIVDGVKTGMDKTAEYLYDIKPGETSGTLGAIGGLTGRGNKGENKSEPNGQIEPAQANQTNNNDFTEVKKTELITNTEDSKKKIEGYKAYIDKANAEIKNYEDRIINGETLNVNEQKTLVGMQRKVRTTENIIKNEEEAIQKNNDDIELINKSVDKNKAGTETYLPKLETDLNGIKEKYDVETISGVKSPESIYNKVKRKNETNPEYSVDSIKDGVRGTVIVKDVNDIPNVLQELKDKGYEIEANIEKPLNDFGYKGINTNVDLGDGYKGEVQVHTPESWKIKKESDAIYQKWRDKVDDTLSPDELKEYQKDIEHSIKLSDNYWGNLPEDLRDNISSFDNRGDVMIVPKESPEDLAQDKPLSNERNNLPSDKYSSDPSSSLKTNGNFSSEDSISNNLDSIKDNKTNTKSQEGTNNDTTDGQGTDKPAGNVFGRFWEADLKPGVKKERQAVKDAIKGIINMVVPTAGVNRKIKDIAGEMKGMREYEAAKMEAALDEIYKGFEKMSIPDRIQFIDRMKQGISQKNEDLNDIAKMFKSIDDDLYSQIRVYKPDLNFVENHFRLFWERGSEEELQRLMKKSLQGSKGFMKTMKFETMSEGIFAGLKPLSTNPVELFMWHYNDVMKYLTARKMFDAMKKSGQAEFVKKGQDAPDGMVKVNDQIGKVYFPTENGLGKAGEYYFDEGAARLINNYLSRDYLRHIYDDEGAFKKVTGSIGSGLLKIKNIYTAVELGASPFHAVFETVEAMGSTIGLGLRKCFNGMLQGDFGMVKNGLKDIATFPGEPIILAREGGNVVKYIKNADEFLQTTRGKDFMKAYPEAKQLVKDLFIGGGKLKMDETYKIGAYENMKRNFKDGNYIGAMMRAIPGGAEMMMKPLFEIYIPRLKLGMFLKEYSYELNLRNKEIASGNVTRGELARKVWNFTEDRFGEMNFDNLWWDRTFKTGLQILFRSVTWKLGNLRAFTGAPLEQATEIYNAIKQNRMPHVETKMGWLMGMSTLTAALGGTIQYATTGQMPQQLTDYIFPRIDKNDPEQRISVPSYWKDIIHLLHKPAGYISSSLAGIWGKAVQLMRNRDYYGTEITNDEDKTSKKLWDMFTYIVPKPFSLSGYFDAQKSGATKLESLAGFTGFSKAPKYIGRSKVDNMIYDAYADMADDKTITKDVAAAKDYKNKIKETLKAGDKEEAYRLINEGIQQGIMTGKSAENMLSGENTDKAVTLFMFINPNEQEKIIKEMSPDELKRFGPSIKQENMEKIGEINQYGNDFLNSNPEIKGQVKLKALQNEQKKINDLLKYTDETKREELRDKLADIKDQLKDLKAEDWYYEKKLATQEKRRKRKEETE